MSNNITNARYLRNQQVKKAGVWVEDMWGTMVESLGLNSVAQKSFYLVLLIVGIIFLIKIIKEKTRSRYLWSQQNQPVFLKQIENNKKPYNGLHQFTFSDKNNRGINYIPSGYFQLKNGNNFTFGYWLKINSKDFATMYGSGNQGVRHVWNRGPAPQPSSTQSTTHSSPSVTLHQSKNVMLIQFQLDNNQEPGTIKVRVPMDKWFSYFIVVSNSVVEVYINGRLEITSVFANISFNNVANVFVGGDNSTGKSYGFPGNLAFLTFYPTNLSQHDIIQNYRLYKTLITNYEKGISNKKPNVECPDCSDNKFRLNKCQANIPKNQDYCNTFRDETSCNTDPKKQCHWLTTPLLPPFGPGPVIPGAGALKSSMGSLEDKIKSFHL